VIVYIAGAIDLIDRATAERWRSDVKRLLEERGVDFVDPLYAPTVGHSAQDVYMRNRQSFDAADAVFAEHAFHVPHYGTTVEIEESVRRRKPTVVWVGDLRPPLYLLRHKGSRFVVASAIPEAVDALVAMVGALQGVEGGRDVAGSRD